MALGAAGEAQDTGRAGGAIWLILLAMAGFAAQDVAVKLVAEDASIWQMQLIRSLAVLGLLALVVRAMGRPGQLWPSRLRWPLIRAAVMAGAYFSFYASLPFLTLSEAAAAFYVGPLLITVFAAVLLGEPIGPRRIVAVCVGFLGVLMIVRPGLAGWSPVALLPVLAATCYALGVVTTRWRCRDEPGFALTFVHNVLYSTIGLAGVALFGLLDLGPEAVSAAPFLLTGWEPLGTVALALILATAATHMVGMLASVAAYRRAEASRIAPFEYSYLAIMPLLDLAIWGRAPDGWTIAGMVLIMGAGGFVAWREGRPARPRVQLKGEVPWVPEDGPADRGRRDDSR